MTAFTTALTGTTQVNDSILTQLDTRFLLEARQGFVMDQVTTVRKNINGPAIQFPKFSALTLGDELDETVDPDSEAMADSGIVIIPKAYGKVVTITELSMIQSQGIVDAAAVSALAQNAAEKKNSLATLALSASTNVLTAGGKAIADLTASDVLDRNLLIATYAKLKGSFVGKLGGAYALVLHPQVIADLKANAAAGSWNDVNKYTNPGEALIGEVGMYEGFRIIENAHCKVTADAGAGAVDAYESYAVGLNGLGLGISQEIRFTMTQNDKLNRFTHAGWKGIFGYQIVEPTAVVKLVTASAFGAN